jgi:hypothetical protein
MARTLTVSVLALALLAGGCATAPGPVHTSSSIYMGMDCPEMVIESTRMQQTIAQQSAAKARKDAINGAAIVAGAFLFWPALFFIQDTSTEEGQIAQMRVNHAALVEASARKGCDVAPAKP